MSKTIDIQIEKGHDLLKGLRRHVSEKGEMGISRAEIERFEAALAQLEAQSREVDTIREELVPKVRKMNESLTSVKSTYLRAKKMLKDHYPQEQWLGYGIGDKR